MKNSLLKNGFYNAVGGAARIGLGIVTIPMLIHILGVEEYGLWTLASAVVVMITLADAGLSVATTVFVSQDLGKEDTDGLSQTLTVTFGAMLILATFAAIALWMGSESIINFFPKLTQVQQLKAMQALRFGSLVVWTRLFQYILIGVEQAYQCYGLMNLLNTFQAVLLNFGLLAVAWIGGQTVQLMQWQAVASLVILFSHLWIVRSLLGSTRLRLAWNKEKGFAVGRYSVITWLTSLGSALFSRVDRLIVGSLLGTQVLGIYAGITDITCQINVFSSLLVQPLLPGLSNLTTQQNIDLSKLQQQIKQAIQINAVAALGLGASLITLSPLVLNLVFPSEIANNYVLHFCIATVIYSLSSMNAVGFFILLSNSVTTCAIVQLISSILSLALITLASRMFGLIGAIFGNAGYISTLLLNILGMKQLSIQKKLWVRWLYFPGIWFLLVTLVNTCLMISYKLRIIIFIFQTFILLLWFYTNNKNIFSKFIVQ